MKRVLLAACAVALVASNPFDPDLTTTQPRRDNLAGKWQVIHSEQYSGKQLQADNFKEYRFVIDDLRIQVSNASYAFRLDPNYEPRQIDIMSDGMRIQGIYRMDGNQLTLCYPMAGKGGRPMRFAALPDSAVMLLVMKKE